MDSTGEQDMSELRAVRFDREMQARFAQNAKELELLRRELATRENEVRDLRAALEGAWAVTEAVKNSTSWRVTKPLRMLRGDK